MSDALNVIFYSFWTFMGTVLLIGVTCNGLAQVIRAIRGEPKKIAKDDGVIDAEYKVIR